MEIVRYKCNTCMNCYFMKSIRSDVKEYYYCELEAFIKDDMVHAPVFSRYDLIEQKCANWIPQQVKDK